MVWVACKFILVFGIFREWVLKLNWDHSFFFLSFILFYWNYWDHSLWEKNNSPSLTSRFKSFVYLHKKRISGKNTRRSEFYTGRMNRIWKKNCRLFSKREHCIGKERKPTIPKGGVGACQMNHSKSPWKVGFLVVFFSQWDFTWPSVKKIF